MTHDPASIPWERAESLFSRALELPPEEWSSFLEEEEPEDASLRKQVLDLLRSSENAEDYLFDLANRAGVPSVPADQLGHLTGKRLGAWRLVELIGQGGMGAVYLAERDDEQFRMKAALKILPLGVSSDAQRRRFFSERQILARLNHPNIARILDGGVTEDGTPFYVMEHVEGVRIDTYCNENRLSVVERVALFEGICDAVQHAHRKLIVHQDLKPGNILVTKDGQVKLLDFGIARMLESEGGLPADGTGVLGRAMTITYASPEQVRGEPVSTASDIYSLGLILYELLAGSHPYRHKLRNSPTAISVVTETIPEPPSDLALAPPPMHPGGDADPTSSYSPSELRSTNPAGLRRALAGDLDTVVLMAIRKEPERRYASVADFSEDLSNFLNRLPVAARPDSLGYRATRFVQRNGLAVAMGTVALLLTVGQVTVALRAAARDRDQAQVIQREASRAEAVTDFLVGLFEFTEGPDGLADTIRARTLVDRGADRILGSLDDQPDTKIQIMGAVAQVYGNLGLVDEELNLLEDALDMVRSQPDPEELQVARYLGRVADAHRKHGDSELAEPYFQEALEIYRRHPEEPLQAVFVLLGYGETAARLGRADSALAMNAEGTRIRARELGNDALSTLRARTDRGVIFRANDQPDSARALYESLLPELRAKGDSARSLLAAVLNNQGYLLRTQEDLAGAEAAYREALDLERQLQLPSRLLMLLNNLASVLNLQGKEAAAEGVLRERTQLARETWPEGHWRVGRTNETLATFFLGHDKPGEALPHAREALESYVTQIADEHQWTNRARLLLGTCLAELGRNQEAESHYLRVFDAFMKFAGVEHQDTQAMIHRLIDLYERLGNVQEAEHYRGMLLPEEGGD